MKDKSKPKPSDRRPDILPTKGDWEILHRYGIDKKICVDDINTYEDDITPLRIYVIMNQEWEMYSKICKKIPKLNELNDVVIVKKLSESLKTNGWIAGYIGVVKDNNDFFVIDGRHRHACCYANGIDAYIKLRDFSDKYKNLKEYTMKVFKYLPEEICTRLSLRYKIMQLLKQIKKENGNIYSSCYKIPELAINGRVSYNDIVKEFGAIKNKRILDIGSRMGLRSIVLSKNNEVVGVENNESYLAISKLLNSYYNANCVFINDIGISDKFDLVVVDEYKEEYNNLLSVGGSIFVRSND